MPRTFLGKPIPEQAKSKPARKLRKKQSTAWGTLLVLPVVACGALLALQKTSLQPTVSERSTGAALARTFASTSTPPPTTAATPTPVPNPCDTYLDAPPPNGVRSAFMSSNGTITNIFPIIPDAVNTLPQTVYDPTTGNSITTTYCSPPFWTRQVMYLFVYKGLAILNWLAEALAIIITLYAGILYMTAVYSEGNAKTAKAWLIGAYGGLAIVFLAKTLVFSAISVAVQDNPYTAIQSAPPIPGLTPIP